MLLLAAQPARSLAGDENIVIGHYAGQNLTTGSNNIEIGTRRGGARYECHPVRRPNCAEENLHRWN